MTGVQTCALPISCLHIPPPVRVNSLSSPLSPYSSTYQGMFTERFREGGLKSKASRARICLFPSRFPIGSFVPLSKVKQTQDVKKANRKEKSTKISSCFRPPTCVVLSSRTSERKNSPLQPEPGVRSLPQHLLPCPRHC